MTPATAPPPSRARGELFVVELDRFQGPLGLLLHLIRSQDIDIFDIPIARITRQFQEALEGGLDRLELDRAGEFLELAATLVRIKAQLLLPRHGDADWDEDPRADLVRRLLEYEYFQEVARVLSSAEADRARHHAKGYVEPRPSPGIPRDELELSLDEFLAAALRVPEPTPEPRHVAPIRLVTVEDKIETVRRKLGRAARVAFRGLFSSWRDRTHVVTSLLACLELGKQQVVRLEQVKHFGSIWIFRGRRFEEDDPESGAGADASETEANVPSGAPPAVREGATNPAPAPEDPEAVAAAPSGAERDA